MLRRIYTPSRLVVAGYTWPQWLGLVAATLLYEWVLLTTLVLLFGR